MNLIQVPLDGRLGQELPNALSKRPIEVIGPVPPMRRSVSVKAFAKDGRRIESDVRVGIGRRHLVVSHFAFAFRPSSTSRQQTLEMNNDISNDTHRKNHRRTPRPEVNSIFSWLNPRPIHIQPQLEGEGKGKLPLSRAVYLRQVDHQHAAFVRFSCGLFVVDCPFICVRKPDA